MPGLMHLLAIIEPISAPSPDEFNNPALRFASNYH
jgi:hypothetical protein